MRSLYPYSRDDSGWERPAWASYADLMAPQVRDRWKGFRVLRFRV